MIIDGLTKIFATSVVGFGLIAIVPELSTEVHAQETVKTAAATGEVQPIGKPVILRLGRGFNPVSAYRIEAYLESEGCPTTVEETGGTYKRVRVDVGDKSYDFKNNEIGDATAAALNWCLGRD